MTKISPAPNKLSSLKHVHKETLVELDKYRVLVESVEDYAIFLMDKTGHIQTWNKGAEKNNGYKPKDIIGKHFSIFYLPEDIASKKPERELELARKFGRVEDEDWRVRKDGTRFWANVVITTLYSSQGEIIGFAKVTRDLTERKHHEDVLRQSNVQLRQQQRELEALNVSKDEFISLASHQLRTPATAIKQLLGMIIEGFYGEIDHRLMNIIQKAYDSNERQLSIVNDLLRVAQVDAGKVILHKKPVNLQKLMASIAAELADTFKKRNQRIKVELAPDVPLEVVIDESYFRMALSNIVDNASKYSFEGSLVILSARVDGDDQHVVVSVKDQGVGMTAGDISQLFEKFVRVQNELSDTVGGSGLGLYWAHRVISLHGGWIEVKSKVGRGSTFEVHLLKEDKNA